MTRKPLPVWWAVGLVTSALVLGGIETASAATYPPNGPGPRLHYTVQKQPAPGHCHYRYTTAHQPLPDPRCTPGALNPKVTQGTIATTICRAGYTAMIRPPTSISNPEKMANARSYQYPTRLSFAEYDHLVPLELGGDPNDARNLWVEPPSPGHNVTSGVHNPKDTVESRAKYLVCHGKVKLIVMQRAMAENWTTALTAVGHPHRQVARPV